MVQSVIEKFKEFELDVISRSDNAKLWNEFDNHSKYFPVAYSGVNLDFLIECQSGNGADIEDLSVIIFWDKKPVALWPLFLLVNPDGKQLLTFLDNAILSPYFINEIRPSVEKQIVKKCISFVNHYAKIAGLNEWRSIVLFNNVSGLSEWYLQSLGALSKSSIFHELFVDLSMDLVEIKSRFRKSYKSLISTGEKLWGLRIIDYADIETWKRFKELHLKVSGRKTRSDLSWDIHYDSIIQGKSFLIALFDENEIMVGGGFFNYTNTEGFYAVGAYDRSLFDKPIGHVVQYNAIKYLQDKKVRWYKIGLRPYASDFPLPTSKELAIGEFKQGFATHILPKFIIKHSIY